MHQHRGDEAGRCGQKKCNAHRYEPARTLVHVTLFTILSQWQQTLSQSRAMASAYARAGPEQCRAVNRTQFIVLFFDSFGDELDEATAQHGHGLDLGSAFCWHLTSRKNDTRQRCRQSKPLNLHRPPLRTLIEDAPGDRSIRLLDYRPWRIYFASPAVASCLSFS